MKYLGNIYIVERKKVVVGGRDWPFVRAFTDKKELLKWAKTRDDLGNLCMIVVKNGQNPIGLPMLQLAKYVGD